MCRDHTKGFFDALVLRPDVIKAIRQVLLKCSTNNPVPPTNQETHNDNDPAT